MPIRTNSAADSARESWQRHGPGLQPGTGDRRRADHGTGCHRSGPDLETLRRHEAKTPDVGPLHHPRPWGRIGRGSYRVYVMYAGIIAEQGKAGHIFGDAKHPYTQGLLASLPTRAKRGRRLYSIPGAVPTRPTNRRDVLFTRAAPTPYKAAGSSIRKCAITAEATGPAVRSFMNAILSEPVS